MSNMPITGLNNVLTNFGSIDKNKDNKLTTNEIKAAIKSKPPEISEDGKKFLQAILEIPNMYNNIKNIETSEDKSLFGNTNSAEITKADLHTLNRNTDGKPRNEKYRNGARVPESIEKALIQYKEEIEKNIGKHTTSTATKQEEMGQIRTGLMSQKMTKAEIKEMINLYSDKGYVLVKGKDGKKEKVEVRWPSRKTLPKLRDAIFAKQGHPDKESYPVVTTKSQFVPNLKKTLTTLGKTPESGNDGHVKNALKAYQKELVSEGRAKEVTGKFGYRTWRAMMEDLAVLADMPIKVGESTVKLDY